MNCENNLGGGGLCDDIVDIDSKSNRNSQKIFSQTANKQTSWMVEQTILSACRSAAKTNLYRPIFNLVKSKEFLFALWIFVYLNGFPKTISSECFNL